MRNRAAALFCSLLFAVHPVSADQQWDPSTLDERIPGGMSAVDASYRQCLEAAMIASTQDATRTLDVKSLATASLDQCEGKLQPIVDAAAALQVPAANFERFLQMKRSKAELSLLRSLYFENAQPGP